MNESLVTLPIERMERASLRRYWFILKLPQTVGFAPIHIAALARWGRTREIDLTISTVSRPPLKTPAKSKPLKRFPEF
jgi:hypothetical protein